MARWLIAVLVVGCGGGTSSGTAIADDCTSYCDHAPACGETTSAPCASSCEMVVADDMNPAFFDAFVACYLAASPCTNKTDDNCLGTAFSGTPHRPNDDDFQGKCQSALSACGLTCTQDAAQCALSVAVSEQRITTANACLTQPCAGMCACIASAFDLPSF